jgi:hypothetical protein
VGKSTLGTLTEAGFLYIRKPLSDMNVVRADMVRGNLFRIVKVGSRWQFVSVVAQASSASAVVREHISSNLGLVLRSSTRVRCVSISIEA